MGLEQRIFTTSKAIAKAIYEGNIVNDAMWNETSQIEVHDANPSEEREANLEMVDSLGAQGVDGPAGRSLYQIGLFSEFNGLHGWFLRLIAERTERLDDEMASLFESGMDADLPGYAERLNDAMESISVFGMDADLAGRAECLNGAMVLMNSDELFALMTDALKVLHYFDVDQGLGELFAKGTFPVCDGHFYGSTEYDDVFRANLSNLAAFAHTVLSLPEAEDALFAYSPRW